MPVDLGLIMVELVKMHLLEIIDGTGSSSKLSEPMIHLQLPPFIFVCFKDSLSPVSFLVFVSVSQFGGRDDSI